MALSIFADALPFTEMQKNYNEWFDGMQIGELLPNIAYSSSLHWQLYCDKYPDDRGILLDWKKEPEPNKSVRLLSSILRPLDYTDLPGLIVRKAVDRKYFHKNMLANIPFKFRKEFTERGKYLFWDKNTYGVEPIFKGYNVVSQDEGHLTFEAIIQKFYKALEEGNPNIFLNTGFADALGHTVARGEKYSARLKPYMETMHKVITDYLAKYPDEEVLLISDHGMSTIEHSVEYPFEELFGKQSKKSYIVYTDSCFICIWCQDKALQAKIEEYLSTKSEGHLMTADERKEARATNPIFGDIIYILREGYCCKDSWFGKGLKGRFKSKENNDGAGMHGFWPERSSRDQMASVVLINGKRTLDKLYTYPTANKLINQVMQGV